MGSCVVKDKEELCLSLDGSCVYETDGYYVVSAGCFALGLLIYFYLRHKFVPLQRLGEAAWVYKPSADRRK